MSEPSGTDLQRNKAIVDDILERTGNKLNKSGQPQSEEDKAIRRLDLANQAVALRVKQYYEDHPIQTNPGELQKLIMQIYMFEFSKWNKDDCIFMLTIMQSANAMKKFGY